MGRPLEIVTNSADVLAAAANLWDEFTPLADSSPIELRIEVCDGSSLKTTPSIACGEHAVTIAQGPRNFAIAHLDTGRGEIRVTADVARNTAWFVYHFLEPIAYVLLGVRHFTMIHASCVALENSAAVLCGGAGTGKTCLAYACAKRGWSFLSGDAVHLVREAAQPLAIGRPFSIRFRFSARKLFPELGHYRAILRPNGKRDFELDPRPLGVRVSVQAPVGLIVFLNRVSEIGKPTFETVRADEAKNLLSEWICLGNAQVRSKQREALEPLLEKPRLRLTFSDPYAAEELLRTAPARNGHGVRS